MWVKSHEFVDEGYNYVVIDQAEEVIALFLMYLNIATYLLRGKVLLLKVMIPNLFLSSADERLKATKVCSKTVTTNYTVSQKNSHL